MPAFQTQITQEDIKTSDPAENTRDAVAQAIARALQGSDLQGLRVETGDHTVRIADHNGPEVPAKWFHAGNIAADALMSPGVQEWVDHYRKATELQGPARTRFLQALEPIDLLLNTDARELSLPGEDPEGWN